MNLEYTPQELISGKLNQDFIRIKNCDIVKPTWKDNYGEEFFLGKRKGLSEHRDLGLIYDRKKLDGEYYYLYESASQMKFGTKDVELGAGATSDIKHFEIGYGARDLVMAGLNITAPTPATDPAAPDNNDVFLGSYLQLTINGVGVDAAVTAGEYLHFDDNNSNLAGITTKIWYKETVNANSVRVYIRGTNKSGTTPTAGDPVSVYSTYGPIPIVADTTGVYALPLSGVGAVTPTVIFQATDDDYIVDITMYNGVLFIMTKRYIFFSQTLTGSNTNIYPLDFIDNVNGGLRIVPFGKMMVLFGVRNAIITPINATDANLGYVYVDLNYEHDLYSKYSVLSHKGSLYVLQDDQSFVKVNINSVSNTDYNVDTEAVEYKGMLDNLTGDVRIRFYDKSVMMYEHVGGKTNLYKYNTEYSFWNEHEYDALVYGIEDLAYGDKLWELAYDKDIEQEIQWHIGGEDISIMKMLYFIKFVVGYRDDERLDYLLDVTTYIGGTKETVTHKLNNYSINTDINPNNSLGNEIIGRKKKTLGNVFTFSETVARTGELFIMKLRSNGNELIYGGSMCAKSSYAPFVGIQQNKH